MKKLFILSIAFCFLTSHASTQSPTIKLYTPDALYNSILQKNYKKFGNILVNGIIWHQKKAYKTPEEIYKYFIESCSLNNKAITQHMASPLLKILAIHTSFDLNS